VREADLLLHVLDVSNPNFRNLYDAVLIVLKELDSLDKPLITVLNKIDKLEDKSWVQDLEKSLPKAVRISAKTGENMEALLQKISEFLAPMYVEINVDVPIQRMDLVNLAHEEGQVYSIRYDNNTINIRASVPSHLVGKFK
jgi:GTP-binding protein HflX